jgi:hypothetical protein
MKQKPIRWIEQKRELVPDSLRVWFGESKLTFSYATMDYRVWEKSTAGEFRMRVVQGEPMYEHDYLDLSSAFAHARICCREIQSRYETTQKKRGVKR